MLDDPTRAGMPCPPGCPCCFEVRGKTQGQFVKVKGHQTLLAKLEEANAFENQTTERVTIEGLNVTVNENGYITGIDFSSITSVSLRKDDQAEAETMGASTDAIVAKFRLPQTDTIPLDPDVKPTNWTMLERAVVTVSIETYHPSLVRPQSLSESDTKRPSQLVSGLYDIDAHITRAESSPLRVVVKRNDADQSKTTLGGTPDDLDTALKASLPALQRPTGKQPVARPGSNPLLDRMRRVR